MSWTILFLMGLALMVLLEFKTSRPDGQLVRSIHPYRQLMPFVMKGRNESAFYYEADVPAEPILDYIDRGKKDHGFSFVHCSVAALGATLAKHPRLNQFISGRRLYRRNGGYLTFSMKRKKLDNTSKIAVVKMRLSPEETFREFCERVDAKITVERSNTETQADKEYKVYRSLPRPLLNLGVWLWKTLDYYNLLPGFLMESDGMYTSVFVANLGSFKSEGGWHHLYEWGNCPIFIVLGMTRERVVLEGGVPVSRKFIPIRITLDERIDDGMTAQAGVETFRRIMSNPDRYLGSLAPDAPRFGFASPTVLDAMASPAKETEGA